MKSASKIPRLRLLIEQIANRAEAQGLTVYASSLPAAYLIRADEEVLVVTHRKGYLRIKKEHIQPLIEELANIQEDMK